MTDWIDGYLARAWKQETKLGAMLDPIADKAMVVIALMVIVGYSSMSPWLVLPATVILFREVFVSGLREYLGDTAGTLKVTKLAKWKTTAQMVAIAVLFCARCVRALSGNVGLWAWTRNWSSDILAGHVEDLHGPLVEICGHGVVGPHRPLAALDRGRADADHRLGLFPQGLAPSEGGALMDVLYFAWVRERIGLPKEQVETEAATVADLVAELRAREERYAVAFSDLSALRVAVDQELSDFDAPLAGVREVAFFPPMTGG